MPEIGAGEGVESMGLRPANGAYTPQPGGQSAHMVYSPSGRPLGPASTAHSAQQQQHLSPLDAARQQEAIHAQEQRGVSSLQNAVSAATGGGGGGSSGGGARAGTSPRGTPGPSQDPNALGEAEKRPPVEFNHAISYVNKIKNRFSQHPDIYKQFLEILQTYQRESKPIQDVYGQVTRLFNTAPDLLEDFKQFLPESAAAAKAAERGRIAAEEGAMLSNLRHGANDVYGTGSPVMSREAGGAHMGTPGHGQGRGLPPVGNFAPTPMGKGEKKRKNQERQGTVESVAGPSAAKAPPQMGGPANKRQKQTANQNVNGRADQGVLQAVSPSLVPALPVPIAPTTSAATSEEMSFFDRAKKVISNKNTMNEFLKLCNLFSQDLIDGTTLVHRAKSFIGGNPDLMKWFSDFVGFSEQDVLIENKARIPPGRISLSNCRGLGPSYRLLPKRERVKPCSGRDELCNAVLNDEWASHPTWASEDSGFIAHRKNVHEEGLHRIEEERHDYDYNIEACARTIQLLEPIAQQLRRLSEGEQRTYQLPQGLGGQSETIYKRIIMKIYGREKGADVVNQLHNSPYQVIPVLLNRLKERLETWKMAQREWEKVWREQTQRMFWRSLDHQAVGNAKNDKRQFQTKTLQTEVAVRHEEMRRRERAGETGLMRREAQLSLEVHDLDVVVDAAYLLLQYTHNNLETEHPRLAGFVGEFVPLFFGLDKEVFEAQIRSRFGGTPFNEPIENGATPGAEDATAARGRKPGKSLLRTALDRGRGSRTGRKDRDDSAASNSRASTPDVASQSGDGDKATDETNAEAAAADDGAAVAEAAKEPQVQKWFAHPEAGNATSSAAQNVDPNEPQKRDVFKLWANTPLYCFIRMFFILYERLYKVKVSEDGCRETVKNAKKHKPAMELGIMDKTPDDFFSDTSETAQYYPQVLGKLDDVLKGDLEFTPDVEETLRRFYLQSGYPLYAFEKMISQTGRYAIAVLNGEGKEKSWDIYQAFKRDRAREVSTVPQSTEYKKSVEKLVREGDVYRVDWEQSSQTIKIYLAKKDDPAYYDDGVSPLDQENRWRTYVSSYQTIDPTDGVPRESVNTPLLMRNMRAAGANPDSLSYPPSPPPQGDNNADSASGSGAAALAAVGDRLANRLLANRLLATADNENLTLRIAVNGYKAQFQPNTAEGFLEPREEREGGEEGTKASGLTRQEREESMKEMFERNHVGMKDMPQEEMERKNMEFGRVVENSVGNNNDEDVKDDGGEAATKGNGDGDKMEVDG
ncbi:hypothetical protein D0862_10751 [Hortaea werneckii]|uniref:Histone deacetylase interacting domain-containing protein n=1 Tax=Hortaea werneckii TaxID=91943 RepID=A0A3M7FE90_HORWE|nr:hypothetical protein D0862_10751 [Hortaea werneckii]